MRHPAKLSKLSDILDNINNEFKGRYKCSFHSNIMTHSQIKSRYFFPQIKVKGTFNNAQNGNLTEN